MAARATIRAEAARFVRLLGSGLAAPLRPVDNAAAHLGHSLAAAATAATNAGPQKGTGAIHSTLVKEACRPVLRGRLSGCIDALSAGVSRCVQLQICVSKIYTRQSTHKCCVEALLI